METPLAIVTPNLFAKSETFITQHIRKLAPNRSSVIAFAPDNADQLTCPSLILQRMAQKNQTSAAKAYKLIRHGSIHAFDRRETQAFVRFLVHHNVRTVLAEYGTTACAIADACRKARVSLHVHFHGFDATQSLRQWHMPFSYRRLFRFTTGTIFPSRYLVEKLTFAMGYTPPNNAIIPYGIDTDIFCPSQNERNPNLIAVVGRFVEKKGPVHTINAFASAAKRLPELQMEMVGEGPLLESCKRLANQNGLQSRIRFHGVRDHAFVLDLLRRAALFCQHSVTASTGDAEGLGITLLEAMACATPVVVTKHNGFTETVLHGTTGFLVDEYDIEAMARHMHQLATQSHLRQSMGLAARERTVAHFSEKNQLNRLRETLGI